MAKSTGAHPRRYRAGGELDASVFAAFEPLYAVAAKQGVATRTEADVAEEIKAYVGMGAAFTNLAPPSLSLSLSLSLSVCLSLSLSVGPPATIHPPPTIILHRHPSTTHHHSPTNQPSTTHHHHRFPLMPRRNSAFFWVFLLIVEVSISGATGAISLRFHPNTSGPRRYSAIKASFKQRGDALIYM